MLSTSPRLVPQSLIKDLIIGNGLAGQSAFLLSLKQQFDYDYAQPPLNLPLETYINIIEHARQTLFAANPKAEVYFQLGTASLDGHFQSPIGQINKIAVRMFSIEKAAQLYIKTQKYNYPFGQHQMEEVRKGYLRYRRSNVPTPPDFTCGVINYLVKLSGGKNVIVTHKVMGPVEILYEAQWEA